MNGRQRFSGARWWAVVLKEFTQLKRDRLTFAMIVGIPIMQMALFGFAINTIPRHLDTGIISADDSDVTRDFVEAMQNSSFFKIVARLPNEEAGREALAKGKLLFVVNIPAGFTRQVLRREKPSILIEADATDPTTTGSALSAVDGITQSVIQRELNGPLASLAGGPAPFNVDVHPLYNPDEITQYNVVPGLMGMILTLTMVMMTGLAVTTGTRTRHDGEPAGDAIDAAGSDDGQAHSLYRHRTHPSIDYSCGRALRVFRAILWQCLCGLSFGAAFYRGKSDGGNYLLVAGAESTAGSATGDLLFSAQHYSVGIHVSVQRDAGMGSGDWKSFAADLFQPAGSRNSAEGQWVGGFVA